MTDDFTTLRVLMVAPVLEGTGEILTALQVATQLMRRGAKVGFLATPLARQMVQPECDAPFWPLSEHVDDNVRAWDRALLEFRPNVVLFADYPLMFFPGGAAPLVRKAGWIASLDRVDAALVTFDHFGFAQGQRSMFLGPPHLGFFTLYELPALPERMHVLLPCPMHDPGPVAGRNGTPFKLWEAPPAVDATRRATIRETHLAGRGGKLVVHSVPGWALQGARDLHLPLYEHLPELLEHYLGECEIPVTLVSVNDGRLLRSTTRTALRIQNVPSLPAAAFEQLLLSADLFITENGLSISMGKALCAGIPCGALINSARALALIRGKDVWISDIVAQMERERTGAVYPWFVFPGVTPDDVERIGLYRDNRIAQSFSRFEMFGGDTTRLHMQSLLFDQPAIDDLLSSQRLYQHALSSLTTAARALYVFANA